jgi:2-methylcitrate dehydratase PrpD
VQYCLARALLERQVVLQHFENDAYRAPAVRALLARIHAAPHPEMSTGSSEHFGAEVRVTLTDGRVLARRVGSAIGRGSDDPLPVALLEAKFLDCASRVLPAGAARGLLAMLHALEHVQRISDLTRLMLPPQAMAAE